jgi:ribosomal protein S6
MLFKFEQELTTKSSNKLREVESTYQKQLEDTIRAQAEGFHSTMKKELSEQSAKIHTELQDDLNHQVAVLRKDQVKELLDLQPEIQSVVTQLGAVKLAADRTAEAIKQTIDIHQLSAAVLSLELALTSPTHYEEDDHFIAQHFAEVRKACHGDAVVKAVLDSLPPRVVATGAFNLPELQVRFNVMREEVRKTSLTPEAAPKMIG